MHFNRVRINKTVEICMVSSVSHNSNHVLFAIHVGIVYFELNMRRIRGFYARQKQKVEQANDAVNTNRVARSLHF